ncbi:lysozyme [Sodalis sp. RH19]|uniref:lysozyme n=1 Tax=Sodalis sp. RH19 TaxID=3394334 RepID=UPI0039B6249B
MKNTIVKRCTAATVLALAALLLPIQPLKTSPAGLRLIAQFEGCYLSPYRCAAGVWTDGIGHTEGVIPGCIINERQAAVNLVNDVRRIEQGIALCMPVGQMPQAVYDAVVAFAFNVGIRAACRSTLAFFIHQAQWRDACHQLPRWIYVKGTPSLGLARRRQAEMALCLSGAG